MGRGLDIRFCAICGDLIELIVRPPFPTWWAHIGQPRGHMARPATRS